MVARFLAGGFLLAELLGLAFFVGAEGSTLFADPRYDEHQLFHQCAAVGDATDCGSVCFYANCERERCRQVCRTRRTCESRGADGKCESWDREPVCREVCTTHYYRCRFLPGRTAILRGIAMAPPAWTAMPTMTARGVRSGSGISTTGRGTKAIRTIGSLSFSARLWSRR